MADKWRAWGIIVIPWADDRFHSIIVAATRAKAIARTFANAREAGYKFGWCDFKALRAPEYDDLIAKHGMFSWEFMHAQRVMANARKDASNG